MARIETYTADLAASRGVRGRVQEGISVGDAVRPYAAAEQLGETLQQAGGQLGALADQKSRENEIRWQSDASEQLTRVLVDWQDKNGHREDYGVAYRQFADEQVAEYLKAAPNRRAQEGFKAGVLPSINRSWAGALEQQERNRFAAFDASEEKSSATIAWAFRERSRVGEPEAAQDSLVHELALQQERISIFYQNAPGTAAKLKEKATVNAISGALETDPEFAKELLDASKDVDAQSRAVLLGRIESTKGATLGLERQRFAFKVQDALKFAYDNHTQAVQPDIKEYGIYGENAQAAYEKDQRIYKEVNATNASYGPMASENAYEQSRRLEKLRQSGNPEDAAAADNLAPVVRAAITHQTKDPADWIHRNIPEIKAASDHIDALPPEQRGPYRALLARQVMALQGFAPPDAPDEYRSRYLGHSVAHILSVGEATRRVQAFNAASIDDKLNFLDTLKDEYGGDGDMAHQAYNDMLDLPTEKLSVAMRLASTIESRASRKEFIAAQVDPKAVEGLDDKKRAEYTAEMEKAGSSFLNFKAGWIGPAGEGSRDVYDMQTALVSYAQSIRSKEPTLTPAAAMKKAMDFVIKDNWIFASVHGQTVALPRKDPKGNVRTDAMAKDYSRRLQLTLANVDPRKINLEDPVSGEPYFPGLPPNFDVNKPEHAQLVRNIITTRGGYVVQPNTESMTLFVQEEGRQPFQVSLKADNEAVRIASVDDLPDYTDPAYGMGAGNFGFGGSYRRPIKPEKFYPIKTGGGFWYDLGWEKGNEPKTNWPSMNEFNRKPNRSFGLE